MPTAHRVAPFLLVTAAKKALLVLAPVKNRQAQSTRALQPAPSRIRTTQPHHRHCTSSRHHERLRGAWEVGWDPVTAPQVDQSTAGRASKGVLGDDFVGLVLAFSDTHEPEHPRRRRTAACASRRREGHRRRAPGRRDRFALNRSSGWGWWVAGGMRGESLEADVDMARRVRSSARPRSTVRNCHVTT